ncbi:MAG: hypothetical protein FJZ57_07665 [Chlamydiae bacterium]|nr:hypothetical protein [Chlamydiota bacterium]
MGKPHITIRNRIQEKTLSLDERAHKFGTKIRSASIHTVRGMLGVPIKKKKNPKGLMELGSSDEQKRSTSPVLSQESLQSFLSGSTVKSGILSEQFREVDELTETRLRPTESASVRHTEDCELDELASDRAVLGLSPQADRSSFLSTDTLDELHSDSENEVDDSDDDQEESVTTSLSNILSGMSEWIQMGVKTKATSLLLDALGYALTQALKNTQERSVKEQLVDMIEEIENVKQGKGNFEELRENLTRIMNGQNSSGLQVRNMLQLHLQGIFEIPIRESREEEITSRHLLMQNIQGIPDIRESSSINYRRDMPIVQNRLVKNITALSSLQAANHLILNNMLGSQQIADILQSCDRTDPTYLENIKKRFYREVDGLDISILQKIGAKILYAIVDFSTSFSLERFISSLIKKIEELATVGTRQRTQEQHNKIIKHTNDFLCVLKGTLKRVQSNPEPTGNAQSMTEKELSQPKFNHGFTKERLYSETCSKAIAHIFPPLGWTKEFMKGYGKQNILMRTAKSIAQPVVWIAEEVSNRVIKAILHLVLSKSNIIEMVIDKSLNQVARNGYTHSINKIFYEQLRLMWIEMSNTKEGPQEADPSIANKEELRDFIINLYDVLELNRQSRHAVAESTILEKTKESLYKMSTDYSADAIALLINKAKNTFLKPELVPMREYTFMEALNSSLESTATDSEEEMIQLEQDIVQLRDAILSKAIRTVVHKSFDSGPTSTEKAFEKISNKLSSGLSKHIQQFKANLNQENKKELLEGIRNCSRMLLDLQRLAEDDPALRSEAALFDNFYTTPIAKILAELRTSAMSNERKDKKKVIVNQMQVWLEEMPKVRHINSASLPTLSSTVEGAANWIAFKAGKEFFDEAWSLMRKPYIWRYGVVHRTLIPFVESF